MSVSPTHAAGRLASARQVRESLGTIVKRWGRDNATAATILESLTDAVRALYAVEVLPKSDVDALIDRAVSSVRVAREQVVASRTFQLDQVLQRLTVGTPRRDGEPLSVAVEVSTDSDSNFFTSVTGDISDGGVFVATDEPLPVGTVLRLFLRLPTGDLEARGDVAWVRTDLGSAGQGMGVRLRDVQMADLEPIMRVVAEREPIAI